MASALECVTQRVGNDLLVMREAMEHRDHRKITLRPAAPPRQHFHCSEMGHQWERRIGRPSSLELVNEAYVSELQPHFI